MDSKQLLELLNISAPLTTFMQFSSGLQTCWNFRKKGSTGDASVLPFVAGALNCCIWLEYSWLISQPAMQLVNMAGVMVFSLYVMVFLRFSVRKTHVLKHMLAAIILAALIVAAAQAMALEDAKMSLGWVGCVGSILFCASPLATMNHVIRSRNSESLPKAMIICTAIVTFQWAMIGHLIGDNFVLYPNLIGWALSMVQIALCCLFPAKNAINSSATKAGGAYERIVHEA